MQWVYKRNQAMNEIDKPEFNIRVVSKGFTQEEGIDFNEVFLTVVKQTTIRIILSIIASLDLELDQMDVKIIFLYDNLSKTIYMKQLEGLEDENQNLVCLLKTPMYGLKQFSRQ